MGVSRSFDKAMIELEATGFEIGETDSGITTISSTDGEMYELRDNDRGVSISMPGKEDPEYLASDIIEQRKAAKNVGMEDPKIFRLGNVNIYLSGEDNHDESGVAKFPRDYVNRWYPKVLPVRTLEQRITSMVSAGDENPDIFPKAERHEYKGGPFVVQERRKLGKKLSDCLKEGETSDVKEIMRNLSQFHRKSAKPLDKESNKHIESLIRSVWDGEKDAYGELTSKDLQAHHWFTGYWLDSLERKGHYKGVKNEIRTPEAGEIGRILGDSKADNLWEGQTLTVDTETYGSGSPPRDVGAIVEWTISKGRKDDARDILKITQSLYGDKFAEDVILGVLAVKASEMYNVLYTGLDKGTDDKRLQIEDTLRLYNEFTV